MNNLVKNNCSVDECDRFVRGNRRHCEGHASRLKKTGNLQPDVPLRVWVRDGDRGKRQDAPRRQSVSSRSAEYKSWWAMKNRCTNPDSDHWNSYGGRGIKVCDRWLESFENFYSDMGSKPTATHTLDREDNNGNYEPSNCRWATPKEQRRNSDRVRPITLNGETKLIRDWAEISGIREQNIRTRLERGWSVQRAIFAPYSYRRSRAATTMRG